jgi:hypothetical protein
VLCCIHPIRCCTTTVRSTTPMDINSLLSPSESPAAETPPLLPSPSPRSSPNNRLATGRPATQQRKSSGLSQQITLDSPRTSEHALPSLAAHNAASAYQQQQHGVYSQGVQSTSYQQQNYGATAMPPASATTTPEPRAATSLPTLNRQGSTPGMDTLAGTWRNHIPIPEWEALLKLQDVMSTQFC